VLEPEERKDCSYVIAWGKREVKERKGEKTFLTSYQEGVRA